MRKVCYAKTRLLCPKSGWFLGLKKYIPKILQKKITPFYERQAVHEEG